MAFRSPTNTRVPPANNRAVDVAKQAIEGLIDVQQRRYLNAFMVQGYSGVLYTRLTAGKRCSCQSSGKRIKTILNEDGTADAGIINEMLTGNQFGVELYGAEPDVFNITSPNNEKNKYRGTFDIKTKGGSYPNEHIVESGVGDNGNVSEFDLDELVSDFDTSSFGFSDVSCNVCFGTGFVGGYQAFHSNRQVITCDMVELSAEGNIEYDRRPFHATCQTFRTEIRIPRGMLNIDCFLLWNGNKTIPFQFTLDGHQGTPELVYAKADGRPHQLEVTVNGCWTHMELQFNMSSEQAWFEFPRLTKSNDISLLQQTEPFQIILSPNIPHVQAEDIIIESTFGLPLIVQGTPMWNTRNRHVLGWECQVRPVQPQELYALLPKRGRVPGKSRTTNPVHDNRRGQRV